MQTFCLGTNMLNGGTEREWDSWMAGMENATERGAGQEEPRRREASSWGVPSAGNIFSQAHGASPAMSARVGLSVSALRPDLECCRQLGVMWCLTGNFEEKRKTNQREWNMRKDTGDKMHIIWLNNNLGDHDNHLHSIKIQNGAWRFTGLGIILKSVLSRIH